MLVSECTQVYLQAGSLDVTPGALGYPTQSSSCPECRMDAYVWCPVASFCADLPVFPSIHVLLAVLCPVCLLPFAALLL